MSAGLGISAPTLRNTAVDKDLSSASSEDTEGGFCFLSCCTDAMTRRWQLPQRRRATSGLYRCRRCTDLVKRIVGSKQLYKSSMRQSSLSVSLLRLPAVQAEECCVGIGPVSVTWSQ